MYLTVLIIKSLESKYAVSAISAAAAMTQYLLNKWKLYFTLLSYPEGTVHHVERWPNFQARSQKNTSWYPVSQCLRQSESYELLEIIPSFIFYWVFECVQKSVHLKWNKTKCHKKGFSLSLSLSLSLCVFLKSFSLSVSSWANIKRCQQPDTR